MVNQREPITADSWWQAAAGNFGVVCEYLTRAQKAERDEKGHECGHRFEITVRSSLHMSGAGEHTDADWFSEDDRPVTVRAHNLRGALLLAAALPLSDWFADDDAPSAGPDTTEGGQTDGSQR